MKPYWKLGLPKAGNEQTSRPCRSIAFRSDADEAKLAGT